MNFFSGFGSGISGIVAKVTSEERTSSSSSSRQPTERASTSSRSDDPSTSTSLREVLRAPSILAPIPGILGSGGGWLGSGLVDILRPTTTPDFTTIISSGGCSLPGKPETCNPDPTRFPGEEKGLLEFPVNVKVFKNGKFLKTLTRYNKKFQDDLDYLSNQLKGVDKFVLIAHGFLSDSGASWMHEINWALSKLCGDDTWVGMVDWGEDTKIRHKVDYLRAAVGTQDVGFWLGYDVVKALRDKLPSIKFWGIGHSLGAHLMGQAGRCSGCFDRITGLDPAGPLFESKMIPALSAAAADFVDVIHTDGYDSSLFPSEKEVEVEGENEPILCMAASFDGEPFGSADWKGLYSEEEVRALDLTPSMQGWLKNGNPIRYFGTMMPCGDIDFYPNMGYDQPMVLSKKYGTGYFSGSHARAHELFISSIKSPKGSFKTNLKLVEDPKAEKKPLHLLKRTSNFSEMGYHCEQKGGCYFYKTTEKDPFFTEQK